MLVVITSYFDVRKKTIATLLLLNLFFIPSLESCPQACNDYSIFYIIITSGFDKKEVIKGGKEFAKKSGSQLVTSGQDFSSRLKACESNPESCMILLDSNDEPIGKQSWTSDEVAKGEMGKTTFAVAYFINGDNSNSHYYNTKTNKEKAKSFLRKVRLQEKSAYIKEIQKCSYE